MYRFGKKVPYEQSLPKKVFDVKAIIIGIESVLILFLAVTIVILLNKDKVAVSTAVAVNDPVSEEQNISKEQNEGLDLSKDINQLIDSVSTSEQALPQDVPLPLEQPDATEAAETSMQTTEAVSSQQPDYEQEAFMTAFHTFVNAYNTQNLQGMLNAYLPEVRELSYHNYLSSLGVSSDAEYFEKIAQIYGSHLTLVYETVGGYTFNEAECASLQAQLTEVHNTGTLQGAVCISFKESFLTAGGECVSEINENLVIACLDNVWYLVGPKAD